VDPNCLLVCFLDSDMQLWRTSVDVQWGEIYRVEESSLETRIESKAK
jgi:hypothetical protein